MSKNFRNRQRRMWVPLSSGFGLLMLLTVLATSLTFRKSTDIFQQLSAAHERHFRVAEALMRLRSNLYLAGILKRDFLLDRNESQTPGYGEQFRSIERSAEDSLSTIERELGKEQPQTVARLRSEVRSYMRPLEHTLDWEPVEAAGMRWYLLRLQLKQRTMALELAGEIERLNGQLLQEQQRQIAHAEKDFRTTLLFISGGCLVLGLCIAAFTILHTRRLEMRSDDMRSELRRLSHQVVRVQEHERRTISRELHDEVGQMLTGLRMELANIDGPAIRQDAGNFDRIQEAKRLTEQTLQSVRELAMLLRPSMLDDLGLSPAISWQVREFSRRSGLPVDLSIAGEVDSLPDDVRTCVYRVVQEALTNVARHAQARRIKLFIERQGDSVSAAVVDDGIGFNMARRNHTGVGLLGIHERVQELSGQVDIASAPGKGTSVLIAIPVYKGAG